ncbi:MAG: hypothetical protein AAF360_13500 [Pseudomonadota bacterium]
MKQTPTTVAGAMMIFAAPAFGRRCRHHAHVLSDALIAPAETTPARYYEQFSHNVASVPTPPGGAGAERTLHSIACLRQAVSDLT